MANRKNKFKVKVDIDFIANNNEFATDFDGDFQVSGSPNNVIGAMMKTIAESFCIDKKTGEIDFNNLEQILYDSFRFYRALEVSQSERALLTDIVGKYAVENKVFATKKESYSPEGEKILSNMINFAMIVYHGGDGHTIDLPTSFKEGISDAVSKHRIQAVNTPAICYITEDLIKRINDSPLAPSTTTLFYCYAPFEALASVVQDVVAENYINLSNVESAANEIEELIAEDEELLELMVDELMAAASVMQSVIAGKKLKKEFENDNPCENCIDKQCNDCKYNII